MVKYEKVMTRDATLIGVETWFGGFSDEIEASFGFPGVKPIFMYRNGAVESWWPSEYFFKEFPRVFMQWVQASAEHIERFHRILDEYERINAALHAQKRSDVSTQNVEELLSLVERVYRMTKRGFAGLLPSFWIPTWNEEHVRQGGTPLPDALLERVLALREKDALFDNTNDILHAALQEIARRALLPKEIMPFFLLSELQRAVREKEFDVAPIAKRREGYAYVDGQVFLLGELGAVLKRRGYELVAPEIPNTDTITGTVANRGRASGEVRVIMNRSQLKHMSEGNVLVAPMTTPYYLPAMKRAAAVVTDEGGITSHAAIFSREFGIPCVIGTKIATQVLKDGDRVEVDAEKGIIRKLV